MKQLPSALLLFCAGLSLAHAQGATDPTSAEDLFDLNEPAPATTAAAATPKDERPFSGWIMGKAAYTLADPEHLSQLGGVAYLEKKGELGSGVRYKSSIRIDHEAKYFATDFYDGQRHGPRTEFALRENYLDFSQGDWDFRLGRQHIVWGEVVGLFLADVVSARDMREFIIPELRDIRIPQWALRAEHSNGGVHTDLIWVVHPTVNEIGKPGGDDFYPYPVSLPLPRVFLDPEKPSSKLSNSNYGLRFSGQITGWDWSGFAYRSTDVDPTFYRDIVFAPLPTLVYRPKHERITQYGATVTKDLGFGIFKAETVLTHGRRFEVLDATTPGGVAEQRTVDWAAGMDFYLGGDATLTAQIFQRMFANPVPTLAYDKRESGLALVWRQPISSTMRSEVLAVTSLNRSDWMLRPTLTIDFAKQWQTVLGAAVFSGPEQAGFGRFDANDRVYAQLRYVF